MKANAMMTVYEAHVLLWKEDARIQIILFSSPLLLAAMSNKYHGEISGQNRFRECLTYPEKHSTILIQRI
eukprot:1570208-Karenia_brevis.AAC.1